MSLFETLSDMSKQHAENSGSYTFEKPEYLTSAMKATLEDYPNVDPELIERCTKCDGSGETQIDIRCDRCEGTGVKDHQSLEPAPTVSLYNLLDHSAKDLIVAMVAFKNEAERIYDQRESSDNMAHAYTSLCAWAKIFDTAINDKRDRDSLAWAEKTAKEIKETLS